VRGVADRMRRQLTNKLRLRRAWRGSGEHRRKTLRGREACRVASKGGASSGARARRRRNFRTLYDIGPFPCWFTHGLHEKQMITFGLGLCGRIALAPGVSPNLAGWGLAAR
jgi:hypothetical protein